MLTDLRKTPWPWAGGKADAAPAVWAAMGDVAHYVEPFAGSLAVLLRRPHPCNRTYYSETVNDLDGLLVNAWRAMQMSPDAMADAASWPVSEADVHARHLALLRWRGERELEHLMADPLWHDPVMAGWWAWGQSCWIGSGWCSGSGCWIVGADGRITRRENGEEGVDRKRPHLSNNGKGCNHPGTREPGVNRKRPHLGDDGAGCNHAGTREPGVARQRPHLGNDGQGCNHAGTREPGVARQLPHLGDDGQGCNRPQAREPGVARQLPRLTNATGVNQMTTREPGVGPEPEYHPMTMPELRRWFRFLSALLRHVRILNGDWRRAVTGGASKPLAVRTDPTQAAGIFLDPPYGVEAERASDLYTADSLTVAADVRAWCAEHGTDPQLRIVLAGFAGEHEELEALGWRVVEWYRAGFLKGGMANQGQRHEDGTLGQQARERLWLSPHCLAPAAQGRLL